MVHYPPKKRILVLKKLSVFKKAKTIFSHRFKQWHDKLEIKYKTQQNIENGRGIPSSSKSFEGK